MSRAFIPNVHLFQCALIHCTAAHERDEHGETLKDKYSKVIQDQEQLSRTLREQQKMIKVRAAHCIVFIVCVGQHSAESTAIRDVQ